MLHAAIDVAQAGDVIVVASKFPSTDGMIGELIATQCQTRGVQAVILDAGARDSAELREMGFGVWSRAISAAGTSKATPGWVNVPIAMRWHDRAPGRPGGRRRRRRVCSSPPKPPKRGARVRVARGQRGRLAQALPGR